MTPVVCEASNEAPARGAPSHLGVPVIYSCDCRFIARDFASRRRAHAGIDDYGECLSHTSWSWRNQRAHPHPRRPPSCAKTRRPRSWRNKTAKWSYGGPLAKTLRW